MPKVIIIEEYGGPEVMHMIEAPVLPPNSHEVTIRNTAIGLNFIDTYHRSGLYPVELPSHLGLEGAAVVTDLGRDIKEFNLGDRVAYLGIPIGAYSEQRQDLINAADELFTLISKKVIRVHLNTIMSLVDVAEAHTNLESRLTTGSTILIP